MVSLSLCLTLCLVYTHAHAHKHTLWTKGRGWRGGGTDTTPFSSPFTVGDLFKVPLWGCCLEFLLVAFLPFPGLWSLSWTAWDVFRKWEC